MMLFRRAVEQDFEAIYQLAQNSGVGITTLTKDKALLQERLQLSCDSFNKQVKTPEKEYYLFALEATDSGKVVGISAIEAATGNDLPFYSYKLSPRTQICKSLNIRCDYDVLNLVNDNQGKTELCTLFLDSNHRYNQNGLLLSRARFLFMANFSERFSDTVIAEMRGISDEEGNSPFWDHVGRHFFQIPFAHADSLTLTNKQFIADLMPSYPIYIKLLDPAAQEVIGKPHTSTIPALNILLRENFSYQGYVDIFDAGPTISAPLHEIRTIKSSRLMQINVLSDEVSSKRFLLANTQLDFRATLDGVIFNQEEGTCIISKKTAHLLKVEKGDFLRIAPLQLAEN